MALLALPYIAGASGYPRSDVILRVVFIFLEAAECVMSS